MFNNEFNTITVGKPLKVILSGVNHLEKGSEREELRSERRKFWGGDFYPRTNVVKRFIALG